jgi:hypothetical protein
MSKHDTQGNTNVPLKPTGALPKPVALDLDEVQKVAAGVAQQLPLELDTSTAGYVPPPQPPEQAVG